MGTKAYSLNRPIGMGTYPKPEHGDWEIVNFDGREFVEEIGRPAWGYVVYEADVPESELERYEMATAEMCAPPELPPENVMRRMCELYRAEEFEKLEKMMDKCEAKGFDGEAVDAALAEMLRG